MQKVLNFICNMVTFLAGLCILYIAVEGDEIDYIAIYCGIAISVGTILMIYYGQDDWDGFWKGDEEDD